MTDILCFSTTDWDEIWGSRQQIMLRLAKAGNRVLFVERQVGPEHLIRDPQLMVRKAKAWKAPRVRKVQDGLWCYQPGLLPPGRYYSLRLNQIGQKILVAKTKTVLDRLGLNDLILWCYPPNSAPLLGSFSEQLSIYYCIERFAGLQKGHKRSIMLQQEETLLRNVDLVFVHSIGLLNLYRQLSRRPITLIPSGADVAHFQSTTEEHPEVRNFPHPRIGFSGTIDSRADIDLIAHLAKELPEWHFFMIGKIRKERVNIEKLETFKNIHFLGSKLFSELPAYMNGMDVLWIPYKVNELTTYISPLKAFEYLAVGKPIISTNLPELQLLGEHVSIIKTPQDAVATLSTVLQNDTLQAKEIRRNAAQEHTWDARVDRIWKTVEANLRQIHEYPH